MICGDVHAAMGMGEICEETEAGARVLTHCLYPSFEPVAVHVAKHGAGYRVSDHGGAVRSAWNHGRDDGPSHRLLTREAARYHLSVHQNSLVAEVPNLEWLRAAILAVANASAAVANAAVGKASAAAEGVLKEQIRDTLQRIAMPEDIGTDVEIIGSSGDSRHFDYGVKAENDNMVLLNAVAAHHTSIFAKYVAFADTKELSVNIVRFGVYGRPLERGDVSLMMQVTDLIPIIALDPRARLALAR